MELRHYLDILRRRTITIVIVAALTVTVVAATGLFIPPIYRARATVRVIQDVGVLDLSIRETYGDRLMNTYSRILTGWPVLEQAAERLGSTYSTEELSERVKIEAVPKTELMWIDVEDRDPVFARDLANTLAALLVEHAQGVYVGSSKSTLQIVEEQLAGIENELEKDRQELVALSVGGASSAEIEALQSQIRFKEDSYDRLLDRYELARLNEALRANSITIVEPASLPNVPSNALGLTEIGIGLIVGLSGGIGLAMVLENLDTSIHSPHQLEHLTHLPVLGTVSRGLLALDDLGQTNGTGVSKPAEEAYRLLGTNLQALGEDTPLKTILITSATDVEDKSATAVNLAQALAERGGTIFLIDGDLRHPAITKMLNLEMEDSDPGLGSLLVERPALNRELLSQIVRPAKQPNLLVIGSGPKMTNPTALLASPLMAQLLGYLGTQGQMTLLDAPPVLNTADVSVLAPKADSVILVVRQAQTKREQLLAALKQLQASRARVIGTIFLRKSGKEWGL